MNTWCKYVHRLELQFLFIFTLRIYRDIEMKSSYFFIFDMVVQNKRSGISFLPQIIKYIKNLFNNQLNEFLGRTDRPTLSNNQYGSKITPQLVIPWLMYMNSSSSQ